MAECSNDCSMYSRGYLHTEPVEPSYVNFRGQGQRSAWTYQPSPKITATT